MAEILDNGCKYCDWTSDSPWDMVTYHMVGQHWELFFADLLAAGIIVGPDGSVPVGVSPRDKLWAVLSKMEEIADLSDAQFLVNTRARTIQDAVLATFEVGDTVETKLPNPNTGEPLRAVIMRKGTRYLYLRVSGIFKELQASPTTLRKVV